MENRGIELRKRKYILKYNKRNFKPKLSNKDKVITKLLERISNLEFEVEKLEREENYERSEN